MEVAIGSTQLLAIALSKTVLSFAAVVCGGIGKSVIWKRWWGGGWILAGLVVFAVEDYFGIILGERDAWGFSLIHPFSLEF